jgi:hypothetical protein
VTIYMAFFVWTLDLLSTHRLHILVLQFTIALPPLSVTVHSLHSAIAISHARTQFTTHATDPRGLLVNRTPMVVFPELCPLCSHEKCNRHKGTSTVRNENRQLRSHASSYVAYFKIPNEEVLTKALTVLHGSSGP